jgi:hypothetical protein
MTNEMSKAHAAGWRRFQRALCAMVENSAKYRHVINSQRHRDAVRILGRGTEEELKAEMMNWRMDFPALFEA